jgi:hypothetical protein
MKATLVILVALELLTQISGLRLRPISVRKLSPSSLAHPTGSDASHTPNRNGLHQRSMRNRCDEYADFVLKPRWGGPVLGEIVRYFNTLFIGTVSVFILRVMNRFRVFRKEILINRIFNREKGRGLLTVSNHQSVFDDPGVLSAFIPLWRFFFRSNRLRWVLCTEDVFFAVRKPVSHSADINTRRNDR